MVAFLGCCLYSVQPQAGPLLLLVVGLLLQRPENLGDGVWSFSFGCSRSLFLGKSQVLFAVMVVSAALLCPLELSILLPGRAVTPSSCFLPARTSHLHSAEVPSLLFLVPIVICSFCLYSIP